MTIPDEFERALEAYREDAEIPPGISAVMQAALREYLTGRGYLVRPREDSGVSGEDPRNPGLVTRSSIPGTPPSPRGRTRSSRAVEAKTGARLSGSIDPLWTGHRRGRLGRPDKAMRVLEDVSRGAYDLEPFSAEDLESATGIIRRYADLSVGLADAANVVLAHRHDTLDLLTLDERHFRVLRGPGGKPSRLLPTDR